MTEKSATSMDHGSSLERWISSKNCCFHDAFIQSGVVKTCQDWQCRVFVLRDGEGCTRITQVWSGGRDWEDLVAELEKVMRTLIQELLPIGKDATHTWNPTKKNKNIQNNINWCRVPFISRKYIPWIRTQGEAARRMTQAWLKPLFGWDW